MSEGHTVFLYGASYDKLCIDFVQVFPFFFFLKWMACQGSPQTSACGVPLLKILVDKKNISELTDTYLRNGKHNTGIQLYNKV